MTPLDIFYALELPALGPLGHRRVRDFTVFVVGFGLWSWGYLYIWALLYLAARALHRMDSALGWALAAGAFGLCFGALFTPVYFLTQGPGGALAWWAAGIPTDIAHCLGNFAVMLVLYRPLRPQFHRLGRQ